MLALCLYLDVLEDLKSCGLDLVTAAPIIAKDYLGKMSREAEGSGADFEDREPPSNKVLFDSVSKLLAR